MLRTFMKSQYWPWRSPTWDLMILMGGPPWELPGPIFGDTLAGRASIFGPNCEDPSAWLWVKVRHDMLGPEPSHLWESYGIDQITERKKT
jgi:hypothetical protein